VIDTPGIRSFVIQETQAIELSYGYKDLREHAKACKFRECRHVDEPGCAVLEALAAGKIPEWRYRNYKGILLGTTGREGRTRDLEE
jgi:ribosome biogenesis GTPase